jgi:hypothetical protein
VPSLAPLASKVRDWSCGAKSRQCTLPLCRRSSGCW